MKNMKTSKSRASFILMVVSALLIMAMITVKMQNAFPTILQADIIPMDKDSSAMVNIHRTMARKCEKRTIDKLRPNLKSQSEEDQILLEHFNGICGGRYLEMGALDGVRYSNSFVFNKVFDWKGVLIELTTKSYKKLVSNRQNELATINAGVCKKAQAIHLVESTGAAASGIWEFASDSFQNHCQQFHAGLCKTYWMTSYPKETIIMY
mmetsp:Transcript_5391/g.10277  ORF Transcript_5391/g.10277 Transcript_5391/m.10277 type:complete len:208 (-) Transcript_5391:257-880(-)